jgi:membrane carboxypeptidase/penicillin-binding protein
VIEHVLDELKAGHPELSVDDLLQGRIQVYSTVDARVQRIVNEALEHGLERYEQRHPSARGVVQGSIVVLKNLDGSILAETGGRQVYQGRATSYSDFNRVRQSLRQPGSAMKPIVYLAAFEHGDFTLETLVPDEPISVPNGSASGPKWISNYDGLFKGLMPLREALAESRNAVAIWITQQVGIKAVLRTSRRLGIQTPLLRDALFVGSTYGVDGITVGVRIGFDDNRSLGAKETGGRVALPVFREVMLSVYRDKTARPVPSFPREMEQRITRYLQGEAPALVVDPATSVAASATSRGTASPAASDWFIAPRSPR